MNSPTHTTPTPHSDALIDSFVDAFVANFVPGGVVIHRGDMRPGEPMAGAGATPLLADVDQERLPDVIIHDPARNWLFLVEAVTRGGTVDAKRREELARLFAGSKAGLLFVTAFTSQAQARDYIDHIAWETVVWVADAPTHLMHFNGSRSFGPYRQAPAMSRHV